jgi:hypothetical protein
MLPMQQHVEYRQIVPTVLYLNCRIMGKEVTDHWSHCLWETLYRRSQLSRTGLSVKSLRQNMWQLETVGPSLRNREGRLNLPALSVYLGEVPLVFPNVPRVNSKAWTESSKLSV